MSACAQTAPTIRECLERLRPDVHSCLIYETPEEQLAAAVPLMEAGLKRGEKCIYLSDETSTGEVLEAMREHGIDIAAAIRSGALTVIPARTASGNGGTATTLDVLAEAARSVNGGGVTLAREITCAPGQVVDQKQIEDYERHVASCFTGKKFVDVALYNRKRIPPQVLLGVIRSHPVVIWDGTVCNNLHAAVPEERLSPDPTSQEVERVLGNLRDRQRIEDGLRNQCQGAAILPVESLLSGLPTDSSPSGCSQCLSQISTFHEQIQQTEKTEALARMAGVMVRKFEDALTTILLCTDLLMDKLEPDDSRLNLAKRILTEGHNAAALTYQLRAYVRPQRIHAELLDVNVAVAELEEVLRSSLKEQFDLRIVAAPTTCPVKVDLGQLERVLLGLVLNARDAMPKGGTIIIQTTQTFKNVDDALRPGSRAEPIVTLSVTDTGHGMDAKTQRRAFDPFFTTKDPGQGAGLGLSIVHGIVQKQFGGKISVESRPGMGTTVTIYFPRAEKLPD
jgi:signal transduction histidine kinase